MIHMSTFPVSWRARAAHAVKSIPAKGWIALGVTAAVVVASGYLHPALPGFLVMALGCSIVVGREKN